jgi:hypothetical protein
MPDLQCWRRTKKDGNKYTTCKKTVPKKKNVIKVKKGKKKPKKKEKKSNLDTRMRGKIEEIRAKTVSKPYKTIKQTKALNALQSLDRLAGKGPLDLYNFY